MSPRVCKLHGMKGTVSWWSSSIPLHIGHGVVYSLTMWRLQAQNKGHIGYTIFIGAAFFVIILFYIGLWVYYSINGCAHCQEMHRLVLFYFYCRTFFTTKERLGFG